MNIGGIFGFLLLMLPQVSLADQSLLSISVDSSHVFQGGIAKIEVSGEHLTGITGFVRDHEIPFFPSREGSYVALIGVDVEQKSGPLELIIESRSAVDQLVKTSFKLYVREKKFPKEHLSVSASFDRFDDATRKRIEEEQARLTQLWKLASGERLWEGEFLPPVPGAVTSPFGLRRVINGLPRTPHGGTDLKASLGDPVIASNHGKVVLRDDFFFSGKSIVLDHGGGLYTMYFHLADFGVDYDVTVRKGDVIGWVGMTGRVTGPHLHWGVRLRGARVDPLELLKMTKSKP